MGSAFPESVYQEALEKQFTKDGIPFEREKLLNVYFNGEKLKKHFRADFVCYDSIIIELKASVFTHNNNLDQTLNYLKSIKYQLGIVINFGQKSLV